MSYSNSTIRKALIAIAPTAQWVLIGDDFHAPNLDGLDWLDETTERPTDAMIFAAADSIIATAAYQEPRAIAYPPIQEQLDMQYWDLVNGTTVWQDTIEAIKAQYPKLTHTEMPPPVSE